MATWGVFLLSEKNLNLVVNYVKNQKQHHRDGTIITLLETDSDENYAPTKNNQ